MTKEYMFLVYRWVKSFQNSGSIFNQKIQMIKNINTKMKLLLFPFMFVIIVVVSGFVYFHYSGLENSRNQVAIQTEEFIQQLLKGRISVYQFLRTPNDVNKQKVIDNFKALDESVLN